MTYGVTSTPSTDCVKTLFSIDHNGQSYALGLKVRNGADGTDYARCLREVKKSTSVKVRKLLGEKASLPDWIS